MEAVFVHVHSPQTSGHFVMVLAAAARHAVGVSPRLLIEFAAADAEDRRILAI